MESRQPWRTNIMVKRSDRRPFILILDSILVYATLIKGMNLSTYRNLCKAEEIRSTLRIIQKGFYLVYLTHQLCRKQGKECAFAVSPPFNCWRVVDFLCFNKKRKVFVAEKDSGLNERELLKYHETFPILVFEESLSIEITL